MGALQVATHVSIGMSSAAFMVLLSVMSVSVSVFVRMFRRGCVRAYVHVNSSWKKYCGTFRR